MKENPPKYKNVHSSVLDRGEKDPLNFTNVKEWIAANKLKLKDAKTSERKGVKGASNLVSKILIYLSQSDSKLGFKSIIVFSDCKNDKTCNRIIQTIAIYLKSNCRVGNSLW